MTWQFILYFSSILLTCILTGFLAWYTWQLPALPGVRTYALMSLGGCLFVLTEILSMLSGTQAQALFWYNLGFIFMATIPVLWVTFALKYNGRKDWLSNRLLAGMFIIPMITLVMPWTTNLHGLWVKHEVEFHQFGIFWIAETNVRVLGPWFMVHLFYSMTLMLIGVGVFLLTVWQKPQFNRKQESLLAIGSLVALATTLNEIFNFFQPTGFDLFIPGIGISALFFAVALFQYQFLKRHPIHENLPRITSLEPQEKSSLAFFAQFFILFTIGLAVVSYGTYQNYEKQFRLQVESKLSAISTLKLDELQNWKDEHLVDANLFYQNNNFSELVRRYLEVPTDKDAQARLAVWLEKIHANPEYDRISLLDVAGGERASSPTAYETPCPELVGQIKPTLASGKVSIVDFHRDTANGHIHLAILVPIFDPQTGSPLGVLSLSIDPHVYLYPFIEQWPTSTKSAETMLIRREGKDVLYLNNLKFKPDAAFNLRTPVNSENMSAAGFKGITESVDYRGVQVIADVHAVPDFPWILISKMDAVEVYAPLRERLWQTIIFFGALIFVVGAGILLVWRRQRTQYFQSQYKTLEALRASEEKFKLAFSASPDAIAINRLADDVFVSINMGFEQISGHTQEGVVGKTSADINLWKDPEDHRKIVEELRANGEIRNYEAVFVAKNGNNGYGLMSASVIELDGVPHILSITRNISERKRTQEILRQSEERFRAISDAAGDMIFTITPEGVVGYVNATASRIFGGTPQQVIGRQLRDLFPPKVFEQQWNSIQTVFEMGKALYGESISRFPHEEIWQGTWLTPLRDKNGQITAILGDSRDISARKQVEEKLRESEERYRNLVENTNDLVMELDEQGNYCYLSPNYATLSGYSVEEELGRSAFTHVHPDDLSLLLQNVEKAMGAEQQNVRYRVQKKSGEWHWLESSGKPYHTADGSIHVISIARDITDRKQAEEKLRASEERYRQLFENSPIGIYRTTPDGRILASNPALVRMLGFSSFEELAKRNLEQGNADATYSRRLFKEQIERDGHITRLEAKWRKFDGTLILMRETAHVIRDENGTVLYYDGTVEDITEHKKTQEQIRLQSAALRATANTIVITDRDGLIEWANPSFTTLTGFTPAEVMGKNPRELTRSGKQNQAFYKAMWDTILSGQVWRGELINRRKDGRHYTEEMTITPLLDQLGEPSHFIAIKQDISERKRAEEALQASETRFRSLFENASIGVLLIDPQGNILEVNPAALHILGAPSAEETRKINILNFQPLIESGISAKFQESVETVQPLLSEHYYITKWGKAIYMNLRFTPLVEKDGKKILFQVLLEDVTERKLAEASLRQAEENYHSIFENALEGIFQSLPEGRFATVNPAFAHILGYESPEELIETVTDIASQVYAESPRRAEFMQIMAEQKTITEFEFQMKRKDGGTIWVSESAHAVFDNKDNILYYEGSAVDITARKEAENKLSRSEERFQQLASNLEESFWMIDINDRGEIYVSPSGEKIWGMSIEKLCQTQDAFLESVLMEDKHIVLDSLEKQSRGERTEMEYRTQHADGSIHWVWGRSFPISDATGKFVRVAGIAEDITKRKQSEIEIKEQTEDLQLINELNEAVNRGDSLTKVAGLFSEEISQIGSYKYATTYLLAPGEKNLVMQNLSFSPTLIKKIEQVVVGRFEEIQTPVAEGSSFQKALQSEQGIIISDPETIQNWMHEFTVTEESPSKTASKNAENVLQIYKLLDIRSTLILPLVSEKKVIGLLNISSADILTEKDLSRIQKISNHLTTVILREQANIALHENEERYRSIFDGVQDAIFIQTKTGRILEVNNRACEIYGYNRDEFLSKKVSNLATKESKSLAWIDIQSGISTTPVETINRRANGDLFPIEISGKTLMINGDELILVIIRDITERKQSEKNVHQHAMELELLYENGLVFSQLLNPKEIAQKIIELLGKKLNWHHTAIRLVRAQDRSLELVAFDQPGLESTELHTLKERLSKFVTKFGEGLSGWALQQSRIIRSGDVNSDPHYIATYPGINSGLYVPLVSGDQVFGVISIESEKPNAFSEADELLITTLANQATNAFENARLYEKISSYAEELEQHVQARTSEIESTRQRLELAVKTAGIGIWELDVKENKDYWDDRLFTLYGLTKQENLPSPTMWHNIIHPDDLANQLKIMDEALHDHEPYDSEFRVIWPDESIHHIKTTGIVIYNAAGLPERMIGANQDITIHKQAEETLRLANAEMERGLRMKNEFLANMSHELRTPLNAILGISESLEEQISGMLNEKQLKYIRIISESGHHLLDLINDILDLSKIEAGKLELNVQTVSIEKLCTSSLRMIKELAQKKSLNVSFKIDENVKVILGDERRLKQSLVNLLGNAVKFTPQGKKIGLEVSGNADKNEITFIVWDEGIGIDEEDIKLLFKPFVQLNAGLAREYAGTGLGLALVSQMVRLHGGQIDLASTLKVGSRFTITLPWMPNEQKIQSTIKPQVQADNSRQPIKRTGKILIVDDTEVVSQLISEYLRHNGYETIIANNGKEAVELAKQEHPQIIFMDVMMPVMNGLDATRKIRADVTLQNIPIIALTALAMPEDRAQCFAAGMNDHLSKPIQMQELIQIIERYLIKKN